MKTENKQQAILSSMAGWMDASTLTMGLWPTDETQFDGHR